MSLLDDLQHAEANSTLRRDCRACCAIEDAEPGEVQEALSSALAGTIGSERLHGILAANGIDVSVRQIYKHRREAHS